jgi:hypothetical protein
VKLKLQDQNHNGSDTFCHKCGGWVSPADTDAPIKCPHCSKVLWEHGVNRYYYRPDGKSATAVHVLVGGIDVGNLSDEDAKAVAELVEGYV